MGAMLTHFNDLELQIYIEVELNVAAMLSRTGSEGFQASLSLHPSVSVLHIFSSKHHLPGLPQPI